VTQWVTLFDVLKITPTYDDRQKLLGYSLYYFVILSQGRAKNLREASKNEAKLRRMEILRLRLRMTFPK